MDESGQTGTGVVPQANKRSLQDPLGCHCYSLRHNRAAKASKLWLPPLPEAPRDSLVVLPRFSPPSLVWFWCVGPPAVGARHEALNEGSLSAVGGFARRGSNVTDTEQLTARAFEAFQVTLGCCLLMDFSVWVPGGPGQLEGPGSISVSASLAHMCKLQKLL